VVAVLPVLKFARFVPPDAEPASITNPVAAPPLDDALQARFTVEPDAVAVNPVGAPGADEVDPPG